MNIEVKKESSEKSKKRLGSNKNIVRALLTDEEYLHQIISRILKDEIKDDDWSKTRIHVNIFMDDGEPESYVFKASDHKNAIQIDDSDDYDEEDEDESDKEERVIVINYSE